MIATDRPEAILRMKVAMLETMPGLRIEVISSSMSVMSAMMAKMPVREPALPSPISVARARIGTSGAP